MLSHALLKRGRRLTKMPLARYLRDLQIDCVLDVGANVGQYALEIRSMGYRGRIESFEPLPHVFARLESVSGSDNLWQPHRYALGDQTTTQQMNISSNVASSSFLELDRNASLDFIDLSTVDTVQADIKRLDDVYDSVTADARHVFMKIDTQGFERNVIEGGLKVLPLIRAIQMEVSLVPTYEGEALIEEMIGLMRHNGFAPWWIMDGFHHPGTHQLFQADVIFVRDYAGTAVR